MRFTPAPASLLLAHMLASRSHAARVLQTSDEAEEEGVKLVALRFTSPRILAQIAKKIIEENLNVAVQVVDPVDPPEGDDWTTEAIKMVGSGAVHAGMEFWSEDLRNCQNLELCTESEPAVESMELGVVGLNGFYIPSYLLESHPELASWEAYKTNETAALFATNSTYPLGRFEGVDHGYGGAQFAEEIISNLDLPFVVEYTDGGEEAALQLLADTVANRGPMIMYMWEPASVIMEYNLSSVDLPNMTEACQVSADTMDGQYNCTYMEEPLYKFVNPGLEDAYPTVYAFIQEFTISNDIDEELIYRVDTEGEDIGVVASDWVDSNRDIWEPWVEAAIEQDGDDTQGDVKHVQDNGNANSGAGVSGQYIACAISGMLFALL